MINNIVTGERLQQLADIYLCRKKYEITNPYFMNKMDKFIEIDTIVNNFNNPDIVFCYGDNINELSKKIDLFSNNFVLITHNADENIINSSEILKILNNDKLKKWYGQNICIDHEKLHLLPIGFANSMWSHGNLSLFNDKSFVDSLNNYKTKKIYFNFNIGTNRGKRQICYDDLKDKLNWLTPIDPIQNLIRLKKYEFCICPEGNGVDTHRLWEALYLRTIPIVLNTDFTKTLKKYNIPIVILNSWKDLNIDNLKYDDYRDKLNDDFFKKIMSMDYFKSIIKFD